MTTYTIRLKNCAFFAHHGVHDEEVVLGQRFFVDADLTVERGQALDSDRIDDTVHYGIVFETIAAVMAGPRHNLIEALALSIAKALCARFPQIRHAAIALRKPSAPVAGILDHVEVCVEHHA